MCIVCVECRNRCNNWSLIHNEGLVCVKSVLLVCLKRDINGFYIQTLSLCYLQHYHDYCVITSSTLATLVNILHCVLHHFMSV